MKAVTQLPKPKPRACPECGHVVPQLIVERIRFDMGCPHCGKTKLSQFVRVEL